MFVNIIKSYRDVVAVCDTELIGKKFEEPFGDITAQLDVKENFYGSEDFSKEEATLLIQRMKREDATFNIVGQHSVDLAIELGIITENGVKRIQGIPFAMVFL